MIGKKQIEKSNDFLCFLVGRTLWKYGTLSVKELLEKVRVFSNIKRKNLLVIVKNNFKYNSVNITASIPKRTKELFDFLNCAELNVEKHSYDYFIDSFKTMNELYFKDYSSMFLYDYLFFLYKDIYNKEIIEFIFFFTENYKKDTYYRVEKNILDIADNKESKDLSGYIDYNDIIEVLNDIGVYRLSDFNQTSVYLLLVLFNFRINNLVWKLTSQKVQLVEDVKDSLNLLRRKLSDEDYKILSLRNGFDGKKFTLEEIGKIYNLTKERIRQKEAKIYKYFYDFALLHKDLINSFTYGIFDRYNTKLLDFDKLSDEIGNNYMLFVFLVNGLETNNITCDMKKNILFLGDIEQLEQTERNIVNSLPSAIKKDAVVNFSESKHKAKSKYVISLFCSNYKEFENILIKRGYRFSDLILFSMDNLFPKGYKLNSDEHFEKLKNNINEKYGKVHEKVRKRTVETSIYNHDYRLVDRGTYVNKDFLPNLEQEIIDKIINYIDNQKFNVYYDTIFSLFKDELEMYEVSNKYMLKGIIDSEINNFFYTKRDYISKYPNLSDKSPIINFIDALKGVFSFDEIKAKFDGVSDHVFYQTLYSYDNNSLIALSDKRYIKISDMQIDNRVIELYKEECEYQFNTMKVNHISSRKVYARLKLNYKGLLEGNVMVKSHFDLFSIMRQLLKDDYYFKNSYISRVDEDVSYKVILKKFVMNREEVIKEDIDDFLLQMNLRPLNSYLEFIEEYSNIFVQVDEDRIVKKELISINEEIKNEIENSITLILDNTSFINTKNFRGFFILPRLNYRWNKYLLAGIVRTYFRESLFIENTTSYYNNTDYIIRRVQTNE